MSEMKTPIKTINGHALVDTEARAGVEENGKTISRLTEENAGVKDFIGLNMEYDNSATPIWSVNGFINYATGEFTAIPSGTSTDYVDISKAAGGTLSAMCYLKSSWGFAFYDQNKRYITGYNGESLGIEVPEEYYRPYRVSVTIPENAVYVRLCLLSAFEGYYNGPEDFDISLTGIGEYGNTVLKSAKSYTNSMMSNGPYNVLVMGDSYSTGANCWVKWMCEVLDVNELVNTAVTGAKIRDVYADRNAYPYSDRPSHPGSGNGNTFGSQIKKLKRLMAGKDLDEGEKKAFEGTAPDIIIIQGGMNDRMETEEVESHYNNAFVTPVENVYYINPSGEKTRGTFHIRPDVESVDRTNFAGAYRYLVEELLTMFPNAQIFFALVSRFSYWTANPLDYDTIARQQKKCAQLCGVSVIDWNSEGNLSSVTDYPRGSGTENDPYTVFSGTLNTSDGIHPNARGARTYGRLAAKVIQQRFVDIG